MGLTRQSVHMTVKHLVADGVVELVHDADHGRSHFVRLARGGHRRLQAIEDKQAVWINKVVTGMTSAELKTTGRVLSELCV